MGMRGARATIGIGIALLVSGVCAVSAAAQQRADNCRLCHRELDVERLAKPARVFDEDVHAGKGFGCVSCHGGDPTADGMEAMDTAKGYVGIPERRQIPTICGRCHSDARFMKRYNPELRVDQVTEYNSSVHGQRLREFDDPKVATCTSCHPAHTIKPPTDPASSVYPLRVAQTCGVCHANATYMKSYEIPVDQLQKYKASVHWKMMSVKGDLSAPTCNDCHGNHGAAPPGITWVGNVCEQCHEVMAKLFAKSAHAKIFIQLGTPGCATCHGNHEIKEVNDEMLGLGNQAVCATCHTAADQGGQIATDMHGLIRSLRDAFDQSRGLLRQAGRAGMEVSQAQFELNRAKDHLVQARNAVHTFTVEAVKKEVDAGLEISTKAHTRGVQALADLQFRRRGLAVSVLIILAVVAGLVVKIRQIDNHQTDETRQQ
jgi:hypothetical protein